jgi:hypothetical protein
MEPALQGMFSVPQRSSGYTKGTSRPRDFECLDIMHLIAGPSCKRTNKIRLSAYYILVFPKHFSTTCSNLQSPTVALHGFSWINVKFELIRSLVELDDPFGNVRRVELRGIAGNRTIHLDQTEVDIFSKCLLETSNESLLAGLDCTQTQQNGQWLLRQKAVRHNQGRLVVAALLQQGDSPLSRNIKGQVCGLVDH